MAATVCAMHSSVSWTKRPMLGRMPLGPESLRQASWKKCGGSQGLSGSECRSETFRCPRDQMKKRTCKGICMKLTVFNVLCLSYFVGIKASFPESGCGWRMVSVL